MKLRLGWFSTGRDAAAVDLFNIALGAILDGSLQAEFSFCFCNRAYGEDPSSDVFLDTVKAAGVPVVTLSSAGYEPDLKKQGETDPDAIERWRLGYDRAVMAALADYQADIAVLAGYMLIVGSEMCSAYTMINLHPALPGGPTGTWQQVIRRLIEDGAAVTGAMIHLVTPELDRGPAISYFTFPIRGGFDEIRADGAARELPLILATITAFADGLLRVDEGRVFAGDREITSGYDLTVQVDDWLATHAE